MLLLISSVKKCSFRFFDVCPNFFLYSSPVLSANRNPRTSITSFVSDIQLTCWSAPPLTKSSGPTYSHIYHPGYASSSWNSPTAGFTARSGENNERIQPFPPIFIISKRISKVKESIKNFNNSISKEQNICPLQIYNKHQNVKGELRVVKGKSEQPITKLLERQLIIISLLAVQKNYFGGLLLDLKELGIRL